jgi:hypothetical protein
MAAANVAASDLIGQAGKAMYAAKASRRFAFRTSSAEPEQISHRRLHLRGGGRFSHRDRPIHIALPISEWVIGRQHRGLKPRAVAIILSTNC